MKKILILSCLFLFFVSSCSNQEEVIVGDGLDYDNMSEEDLRKCAEANGAITWNQFIELMGEFMESEQSPLIETKATSETFSVTGYDNTFLVEENKKVLINKSPTNIGNCPSSMEDLPVVPMPSRGTARCTRTIRPPTRMP